MCFFKSPNLGPQTQTLGVTGAQIVPETKAPEVNAPVFGAAAPDGETGAATGISSLKMPKMLTAAPAAPATTGANKSFNVQM